MAGATSCMKRSLSLYGEQRHASPVQLNLFLLEVRTMSSLRLVPFMRHTSLLSAVVALAVGSAAAQVSPSHDSSSNTLSAPTVSESSSSAASALTDDASGEALPAAPAASGAANGQEHGGYG